MGATGGWSPTVPASVRRPFRGMKSSKLPRQFQLIRAERPSNGSLRSHPALAESSRTRARCTRNFSFPRSFSPKTVSTVPSAGRRIFATILELFRRKVDIILAGRGFLPRPQQNMLRHLFVKEHDISKDEWPVAVEA